MFQSQTGFPGHLAKKEPETAKKGGLLFQSQTGGSEVIPNKQAVLMAPTLDTSQTCRQSRKNLVTYLSCKELTSMIPNSRVFDQHTLRLMQDHDPVVQRYRAFFALFQWSMVPDPPIEPSQPGKRPHPQSAYVQALLVPTVQDLCAEIPGLGETVAFDVTHLYASVQENNLRAYVKERYHKDHQPKGDPDCKLGVKRSTNKEQADGSTKEEKEYLWGYGSGVASATIPGYGDVVLAEYTLPFNENDITYFVPLYIRTVATLGFFPTHITADAAFDAWYTYQMVVYRHGIAAIPLNQHGHPESQRAADGARLWVKDLNWELGGQMRVTLDRESPLYKAIYHQRTSTERINSQSKALGIKRPKVRNIRSVRTLNTLTYLVINARALQRARDLNASLLTTRLGRVA